MLGWSFRLGDSDLILAARSQQRFTNPTAAIVILFNDDGLIDSVRPLVRTGPGEGFAFGLISDETVSFAESVLRAALEPAEGEGEFVAPHAANLARAWRLAFVCSHVGRHRGETWSMTAGEVRRWLADYAGGDPDLALYRAEDAVAVKAE